MPPMLWERRRGDDDGGPFGVILERGQKVEPRRELAE